MLSLRRPLGQTVWLAVVAVCCLIFGSTEVRAQGQSVLAACGDDALSALDREKACTAAFGQAKSAGVRASILIRRGHARLERSEVQGALADFNQSVALDPNVAAAYYGRGLARSALAQFEAAIRDYNAAVKRDFGLASAFYNRAHAHQALGQLRLAERDFATVIELRPGSAAGFYARGRLRYLDQRHWDAFRDLNRALDLDPENGFGRLWRYLTLMRMDATTHASPAKVIGVETWPGALLAMVSGQADLSTILRLAHVSEPAAQRERECAAYFYAGQRAELDGALSQAVEHYRQAMALGEPATFERMAAAEALKQLERAASQRAAQ